MALPWYVMPIYIGILCSSVWCRFICMALPWYVMPIYIGILCSSVGCRFICMVFHDMWCLFIKVCVAAVSDSCLYAWFTMICDAYLNRYPLQQCPMPVYMHGLPWYMMPIYIGILCSSVWCLFICMAFLWCMMPIYKGILCSSVWCLFICMAFPWCMMPICKGVL
jgi:hypothetical protein